ncbi:hypothetical protein JYU29_05810 [Tianweitania sp. BSSL-BM11]|uniref:Uncharacterized protein n=1 Tax=Tianweitania aestuarii TaxID=2814886 RepID=A0ABS5RTB7_9HYPH|nr:hypothetical protein [Tianweitania aestuarii]MBS9720202.1 hypothetical protein [Tianweitania aestuarii]
MSAASKAFASTIRDYDPSGKTAHGRMNKTTAFSPSTLRAERRTTTIVNIGTFEGHRKRLEANRADPVASTLQNMLACCVAIGIIAFALFS